MHATVLLSDPSVWSFCRVLEKLVLDIAIEDFCLSATLLLLWISRRRRRLVIIRRWISASLMFLHLASAFVMVTFSPTLGTDIDFVLSWYNDIVVPWKFNWVNVAIMECNSYIYSITSQNFRISPAPIALLTEIDVLMRSPGKKTFSKSGRTHKFVSACLCFV